MLNKSENATPELLAIYIQNAQASKTNISVSECSKNWVMHNSKSFTDAVRRKDMKAI